MVELTQQDGQMVVQGATALEELASCPHSLLVTSLRSGAAARRRHWRAAHTAQHDSGKQSQGVS